ncbi:MAG: hypothetical protein L6R41_003382 [Letrouitia leprolyta]|nr:MAG: hypothetical protein L6R41_003382 [Letrouitia leprolyta]
MATFTLIIKVDAIIVKKGSSDNLNIARKVNGAYTTTFTGASFKPVGNQQKLLQVNNFQWTESYSVLLTSKFATGMLVSAATEPKEITFGKVTNYEDGVLGDLATAKPSDFTPPSTPQTTFVVGKVPDNLSTAVATKVGTKWGVIYVDNKPRNGVITK